MADIELVIKIPEDDFERCKKKFQMNLNIMAYAIAKGTPLPKGHGRLIDADALEFADGTEGYDFAHWTRADIIEEIENAPTIIEADKENKE